MKYSVDRWKKLAGLPSSEENDTSETLTEGFKNLGMANPSVMGISSNKLNEQAGTGVVFVAIGEGNFGDPERFDGVFSSLENAQSTIQKWKSVDGGDWFVEAHKLDSPGNGEIVWSTYKQKTNND